MTFWRAFTIPGVVEFALSLFFAKLVSYTFLYWLPAFIKDTGKKISRFLCRFQVQVTELFHPIAPFFSTHVDIFEKIVPERLSDLPDPLIGLEQLRRINGLRVPNLFVNDAPSAAVRV